MMRVVLVGLLLTTVVACGPSLSDAAWVWCNDWDNRHAVEDAGDALGVGTYEDTYWRLWGTSDGREVLKDDSDFIKACNAAFEGR